MIATSSIPPLSVLIKVHRADDDLTYGSLVIRVPPARCGARAVLYRYSGDAGDTLASQVFSGDAIEVPLTHLSPGSSYEVIIEDYPHWDVLYTALFNPARRTVYGPVRVPRRYRRGGVETLVPVLASTS